MTLDIDVTWDELCDIAEEFVVSFDDGKGTVVITEYRQYHGDSESDVQLSWASVSFDDPSWGES